MDAIRRGGSTQSLNSAGPKGVDFARRTSERRSVPPSPANSCALIPCRNEGAFVGDVVQAVRRHLPTVVVVDDGSTDGTAERAKAGGAVVLRHATSVGKGAALRTGWDWTAAQGLQWAVMLDGDGQHAAEDIPGFLTAGSDGSAKLIVGNRMDRTEAMPWIRRRANRWLSERVSKLAGVPVPDSQCGFRMAHLPTLRGLGLVSRHFEIESEMCFRFARAGHRVISVPVQVRYGTESSKISPFRDYARWCRWYLRARNSLSR